MEKEQGKKYCYNVTWKYEFRRVVYLAITILAEDLGISYWTLYRIFVKEGRTEYSPKDGIIIQKTEIRKKKTEIRK